LRKGRLNAILGGFYAMGEIRYWGVANRQIFSGLEIYHFPTAGGNARFRVSQKQTKISE
jgi:hypothetical protein